MTYGEAKAMVLVILDEFTIHGEPVNDKCIEARLPLLFDAALCEVPCNWKGHELQADMGELTPLPVKGKVALAVCYNVAAKVMEFDLVVSNEPLVKKYHELMHEEWMARYALGESLKWLPPELRRSAEKVEEKGATEKLYSVLRVRDVVLSTSLSFAIVLAALALAIKLWL